MKKQISQFAVDTSITTVSRILQLVLGLGASIIIARALGPEGKGIYALAILLPMLLASLGGFGIGQASVFQLGKGIYPPKDILGNNMAISLILGAVGSLLGLVTILLWGNMLFPGVATMYPLLALLLIPLSLFLSFIGYFFLGLQKIRQYNFINLLRSCAFLVLLTTLLFAPKIGLEAVIAANILSYVVAVAVTLFLVKRIVGSLYLRLQKSYAKEAFGYGFKVYLGNILGFLHYRIDVFLINIVLNPVAVGLYSISALVAEKIWLISQSASIVLFPKVCSETDKDNLRRFTPIVFRMVLLISTVGSIIMFFLGRLLIVFFFSEKFADSVLPFQVLLIGIVAMSGWRILANDLYGRGRPEINIYINAFSAVTNIMLNVILIPRLGIVGAAWATSVSYTSAFVAAVFAYTQISGNRIRSVILPRRVDLSLYKGALGRAV